MQKKLEALLNDVRVEYEKSEIKKTHPELYYSLITGSLKPDQPLIIGFNWGASLHETYYQQYPSDFVNTQKLRESDLGSMKRILSMANAHIAEGFLNDASQTNYCFFRSSKESDISSDDLKRCQPIFDCLIKTLIEELKPRRILCLSSKLRDYLQAEASKGKFHLELREPSEIIKFRRGGHNLSCIVYKGKLNGVDVGFLPHPASRIPLAIKLSAWKFVFGIN